MFPDCMMSIFTTPSTLDGFHQKYGGTDKGQVLFKFRLECSFVETHFIQNRQPGFKLTINGEKRPGKRDPANHRTGNITLIPLVTGKSGKHASIPTEHMMEP